MTDSPVDLLLEELRAQLHAERSALVARTREIAAALEHYRRSSEGHIAFEFAVRHGLKRPKGSPANPRQAAERLYSLVRELPELREIEAGRSPTPDPPAPHPPRHAGVPSSGDERFATLVACSEGRKLVVIGALSGRQKQDALPPALEQRAEWVDTERDGTHAIGNLPQRIRQRRVAAVIILDKAIQHKHSEPLVAAARDSDTPVAFAGKGGKASLIRALEQLDERLRR